MSERKIDAMDDLEIEIVEAGLDAWKANSTEGGSKLSSMASAWLAMTRVALAPPSPAIDDGGKGREMSECETCELCDHDLLRDCRYCDLSGEPNPEAFSRDELVNAMLDRSSHWMPLPSPLT